MRIKTFKVFESKDEINSNIESILIDIKDEYDYVDINIQHSDPYIFVNIDFDKSDKLREPFDMIKYQKIFDRLVKYMESDGYKYEVRFFKRIYDVDLGFKGRTFVDISENPTEVVFTFEQDSIKESLGIDTDIEKQAQDLFKQISSSYENEFLFPIYDKKGNYFFKLIINKKHESDGTFQVDDNKKQDVKLYTIFLKNRKDYATLLHELKHLSLYLKSKGKSFQDIIFKSWNIFRSKKETPLDTAQIIFYVFNQDEFEAKYHSYYVDIDNYIKNNLKGKPTKEEINRLIKECLNKHSDKSYTWWVGYFNGEKTPKDFNFSNYLSEQNVNRLFYSIIKNEHIYKFDGIFIDTILKDFRKFTAIVFNFYTKSEKVKMDNLRREYEKLINERKVKFKKRFYRLFTIMQEKYIQNESPKNIRKF